MTVDRLPVHSPQHRDPPEDPPGRHGRFVNVLDCDSKHEGTAAGRLFGGGFDAQFPTSSADIRVAPWPHAGRRIDVTDYDGDIVRSALRAPPQLGQIDPRSLRATQPSIIRPGVDFYVNDNAYQHTGKTYENSNNVGNRFPVIYRRANGENLILSGHHRSAAALAKGEPLKAMILEGPWGPPRQGLSLQLNLRRRSS